MSHMVPLSIITDGSGLGSSNPDDASTLAKQSPDSPMSPLMLTDEHRRSPPISPRTRVGVGGMGKGSKCATSNPIPIKSKRKGSDAKGEPTTPSREPTTPSTATSSSVEDETNIPKKQGTAEHQPQARRRGPEPGPETPKLAGIRKIIREGDNIMAKHNIG